jgi:hypothetical protein
MFNIEKRCTNSQGKKKEKHMHDKQNDKKIKTRKRASITN